MLKIHFAPLQGYTDATYRRLHHQMAGGVESYTTPFLRLDNHEIRNKDRRDISQDNNKEVPVVPQIIVADKKELVPLTDLLLKEGYSHIDINMGCAFPMQTRQGRGAGILPHPDAVQTVLEAAAQYAEVTWSVKMRLGMDSADECMQLLSVFNESRLHHITLHPRIGRSSFNGTCDMAAFKAFAEASKCPVWWSGDITSLAALQQLEEVIPTLTDVMIGRGLLARPSLATEYREGNEWSFEQRLALSLKMHDALYSEMEQRLQGPVQLLTRMQAFWEYQKESLPKKNYKPLMKVRDIIRYKDAVDELRQLL